MKNPVLSFAVILAIILSFGSLSVSGQDPQEQPKTEKKTPDKPDVMPAFKNGDVTSFRKWVTDRVKYPRKAMKNSIEGKVIVRFSVNKEGKVVDTEVIESPSDDLSKEVLRVVKKSPVWTPALKDGKPVNCSFTLPMIFMGRD